MGKRLWFFLSEVKSKLFSKERVLNCSGCNVSFDDLALAVDNEKGNSNKNIFYQGYEKFGHLKTIVRENRFG